MPDIRVFPAFGTASINSIQPVAAPITVRAAGAILQTAGGIAQDTITPRSTPAPTTVPAALEGSLAKRTAFVAATLADQNGPLRASLPQGELRRRLDAIYDLARPVAETLASFPPRPVLAELPRVAEPGEAQRQLDAESAEVKAARRAAFAKLDRRPVTPLEKWAVEGDKFVRKATREASLAEGLSFADLDRSRPMSFFREAAAQAGAPNLALNVVGSVQAFEVPQIPGVPPMEVQILLPCAFVPGRPTVVYMTEATSSPFDPEGKPTGTIGEFLGPEMKGLGDVNVVLIRSPYQAEFPNGPRFTAGYDNMQASLASTTQYMDHVVRKLRDSGSGPVIMGGYSLGGAYVNQYRGWFDDGAPGSGADFYIPMAAPVSGYGGLFDPATNDGEPTWWSASQLAPGAWGQQERIARELSPTAEELAASSAKVFALIPRWDAAIQGIDDAYGSNAASIPGGHISGAVEQLVDLTVPMFGKNVTITNWPAMGTIKRTHIHFRGALEAFLENRTQNTMPDIYDISGRIGWHLTRLAEILKG